ncbi:exonuclease domain-containing protein [Streptomyces griseorubiginosus]|uniref:exonuclease domain-containing protein n=1 Tax=Streptomyces griseorubiginosus TaxID=67304 RepID=UPI0036E402EA
MKFADIRKIGFDTESTGVDPVEDRIVTAALVVRGGGKPDTKFSYLINPKVPIPPAATEIHGIDDAKAAEGADPKEALDDIADRLAAGLRYGMPVVAFNLSFDWSLLHYELIRNGLPTMADRLPGLRTLPLIDSHVIDKQVDKYVKGAGQRKLQPTAKRYGVELEDWHEAAADATAALLIAEKQFATHKYLAAMGPERLFTEQQKWRASQQAGLQEWFRTKATEEQGGDPTKVIDGSWPLIPAPRAGEGS